MNTIIKRKAVKSISIAALKAHLSAEIKLVSAGETIVVMDHKRTVAYLTPLPGEIETVRQKQFDYSYKVLSPLMKGNPLDYLAEERGEY